MREWNYEETVKYLDGVNQYAAGTGVGRARKLLKQLGNPEANLKIIHVAGSNGKGSVCAYMDSALRACGYSTGLFSSPHLVDIRERIQINADMIEKNKFLELFIEVFNAKEQIKQREPEFELAYFDYLFAVAMLAFKKEKVDFAILETGLGGRLDATNAVEKPIVSVITTISLEHTAILGDTFKKIATEKAGIIKSHIPVVFCDDNKDTAQVIKMRAKECESQAVPVSSQNYEIVKNTGNDIAFSVHNEYYKNDCFLIKTPALYQAMNATLALTALFLIKLRCKVLLPADCLYEGIKNMYWPGRMEEIQTGLFVDGAHNPQGIAAFVGTVNEICRKRNVSEAILLFSVVSDKDYEQMVDIIEKCPFFKTVIVTQTGGKRKLSKEIIASQFLMNGNITVLECDNVKNAFKYWKNSQGKYMFCAGSLYLAGDIKIFLNDNFLN